MRDRGRLPALPLRVVLVVVLVVLAGLGLLISGVAVTSAIERSLMSRTDHQLRDAAHSWANPRHMPPQPPVGDPSPRRPPSQFYVRIENPARQTVFVLNDAASMPALPADLPTQPITVGSEGGSSVQWRALTNKTPLGSTTVAIRLTENNETVARLVALELIIGAVVLVALGVVAYFVVRRSLRPLVAVEATAAAIAGGDLHRRVPVRGNNTEVDRLSRALNEMLAQIQRGYAQTEASEEAARRSEQKMRRFVADASHELRTPLTTIRGYAELFRHGAGKTSGPQLDTTMLMSRIESEAARMGLLVEDLLTLARLDAQRPLERRPVDLLGLAGDAVHDARVRAPQRTISLDVGGGPGSVEVLGDEARLRQVLSNLVGNALTHTPPDASITVGVAPTQERVVLVVSDTGPGLGPEDAERVFERFYRTDSSRTRQSGGTGLGLSIVAALVAAHHGTVRVDSTPGVGTTFTVELPRADQSGTESP